MNNYKKYLPSEKFMAIVLIIVIFITIFFSIKGIVTFFKNRKADKNKPTQITIKEMIQKDGNDNGIPDWEEYLWGLDPNKNGAQNKEFILSKKGAAAQNGGIVPLDDSAAITENDMLSRQFFAAIVSLQQTGELNQESLQSISDAVGQKIDTVPIVDIYNKNMLTIENDSTKVNEDYLDSFNSLVVKYENADIGSELILISQGIGSNDPQALSAAQSVANAYKAFGNDLVKVPVPNSIYALHLSLANNYDKTGKSIEGLTKTLTDPIIGMRAILEYKEYSDALVSDINKLSEILQ